MRATKRPLLVLLAAATIGATGCGSGSTEAAAGDVSESVASTAPAPAVPTNTTAEPEATIRMPISTDYYKRFTDDKWFKISPAAYTTEICNALDRGADPNAIVSATLTDLQNSGTKPNQYLDWDRFEAGVLYAAAVQYVCPEHLSKPRPN